MEVLQAVFLGIVEGLTEFLPISSTGHLIVASDMIGFYDTSKMFTVVIQLGAIAAVIWFYRVQLWQLLINLIRGEKDSRRFWLLWIMATIPAGVLGLIFVVALESWVSSLVVSVALIIGGIAIWLIEKLHKVPTAKEEPQFNKITAKQALLVGLYQALALIPGVSRSGATIMGGVLAGLDRVTATAFSFYLGIPILVTAGIYKLVTSDVVSIDGGAPSLIAGVVASFVTSLIVISWLLRYVSRHDFKIFAYYRIVFGLILLFLVYIGSLD